MKLRELAHARAGDKGDVSNISVIAHEPGDYAFLLEHVTAAAVKSHMADTVRGAFAQSIHDQRADEQRLDANLKGELEKKGMTFVAADKPAFQAALRKTSFYTDWKAKFGDEGWAALQAVSGQLA